MDLGHRDRQERLRLAHRIVIKVGTSVVTGSNGDVSTTPLESLVRSIATLKRSGRQIVLVSSGAVGLGAGRLGLPRARLNDLAMRQACAAVGQSLLMHDYERLFRSVDIKIAQVLLTEEDFKSRKRYRTLRRTMEKLLKLGVVPIVNENDAVSSAELEYLADSGVRIFGDNDRLASLVMSKLEADALLLLTDVDGLLERSSDTSILGTVIPLVEEITPALRSLAAGRSASGRGGMASKLDAAQIAMQAGGVAIIANGKKPRTLERIFAGEEVGTAFLSSSRLGGKRRWIAYAAGVRGRLVVNAGARMAIESGKASLLSSGVVRIEDRFYPLDVVSIVDLKGNEFARGIANYASQEATDLIGTGRNDAPEPGSSRARVLVTRNNIVLMDSLLTASGQGQKIESDIQEIEL